MCQECGDWFEFEQCILVHIFAVHNMAKPSPLTLRYQLLFIPFFIKMLPHKNLTKSIKPHFHHPCLEHQLLTMSNIAGIAPLDESGCAASSHSSYSSRIPSGSIATSRSTTRPMAPSNLRPGRMSFEKSTGSSTWALVHFLRNANASWKYQRRPCTV